MSRASRAGKPSVGPLNATIATSRYLSLSDHHLSLTSAVFPSRTPIRLVANGRRSPRYPDILLGPFRRLPAWDFLFWQARHLEERRCLEIGRAKPFLIEFPNVGRSKKAAQSAIDDQPEILVPSL